MLFEVALVLIIALPVLKWSTDIAAQYARDRAGLNEARLLTTVVDAGATLALRNLDDMIRTGVGVGNVLVLDLSDLEAEGLWMAGSARLTALGRKVTLILHARGSDELILMARATAPTGEANPAYVPRGGEGVGLVGFVPPDDPGTLRGPGIDYDLSAIQALIGAPVRWDAVAIRVLRMDRDVLPFLHRRAQPGYPQLNQMSTDLDMNGFDLIGVGVLETTSLTATAEMQAAEVTGTLKVDGIVEVASDLSIKGRLKSRAATIDGEITSKTLNVSNRSTFGTLTTGTLTASGPVSVDNDLVVGGAARLGALAVSDVSARRIQAASLLVGTVAANAAFVTVTRATTGQIQALITGRCSGC
ncbi:hypothetical protein [Ruegeria atlantica]|uniref:hypothetical protein n=1 Tax=Ruegeria atlantica TaxID=81569 RepID=UPI00147DC0ED|nr:hypothetical protein [Ruegeria atlantica]